VPSAGALSLYVEPQDGYRSVEALIAQARRTIDMTIYELSDRPVQGLLIAAHHRGVAVRVLLDRAYHGASFNQAAYTQLTEAGVAVRWGPASTIVHQKTLTIDHQVAAVMTGNLTADDQATTRDFVVVDRDPGAVAAIESVFADDWAGDPIAGGPAVAGLVWSPGSESALVSLIASARRSVTLENEEMDAPGVESALEAAAGRGIGVEVVMTADPDWSDALSALTRAGVRVLTYPDTDDARYIHAKAIVVDGATAYVGSQNFSDASLDYNRELGIITTDPSVVGPVAQTLAGDAAGARAFVPA
jgi:cardiolipin synthase